mmetsp:Transcript_37621/g.87988  ORF Transcript_37621/g.87988 Transcript_37621/m.87988 type:complete len:356 (+) Transcript_37621:140-1207(+)
MSKQRTICEYKTKHICNEPLSFIHPSDALLHDIDGGHEAHALVTAPRASLAVSGSRLGGERFEDSLIGREVGLCSPFEVVGEVPADVLGDDVLGREAQQLGSLVHTHEERSVAEWEEPLRQLERLGIVVLDRDVGARSLRTQRRHLVVGDQTRRRAVKNLANGGTVAERRRDHRCVVCCMRHRHLLRAVAGHEDGLAADGALEERAEVRLPLLWAVDVLRTKARERQVESGEQLLGLALARGFDWARLRDGAVVTLFRCIHARRRNERVVVNAPRLGCVRIWLDRLWALGPVVHYRPERRALKLGEARGRILEIVAPEHLDPRVLQVAVRAVRRLALVRTFVKDGHAHALLLHEL